MSDSNHSSRRQFLATTAAAGAAAVMPAAMAQTANTSKWPNKPIRIVVGFPPGGLTDAYARLYADQLATKTGQSVVVDNRPGAGAVIAIDMVAKAPPDGYTLLISTSGTLWQNRVLYSKLPYNLDKDLTPIANFPSGPLVVAVSDKVPARNMKEFIAYAKANPNNINMGSYAPGSYPHLVADQTNRREGTKIQSVHYRGESPMWVDVVSGQLQIAIGSYQAFNTVAGRGVRAIGVTGGYRSPKLPDVPTLQEQGVNDILVGLEGALPLMAPAGTPEAVLKVLSAVAVEGSTASAPSNCVSPLASPTSRRTWPRRASSGSPMYRSGSRWRWSWASSWTEILQKRILHPIFQ
jgi:tripartite-type tricarboxylate transporter receptor subunit TctC